jgi:2-dehydro-3-deoxyphosphogluconate aldolase / (4S)-4-hydroxy-2-oxoglutarate aldolase
VPVFKIHHCCCKKNDPFMSVLTQLLQHKIIAILRGVAPKDVLHLAAALYAGGIRALEVTLNSGDALLQIEQLVQSVGDKMLIGAGTVLDVAGAEAAIRRGAQFVISPAVDVALIETTKRHNIVSIPGAYTATEILQAHKSGGDIIKVFPASDPGYIKALLAPLNHMRLMPTGGISLTNINAFQQAGAVAFGIGSALVHNTHQADESYFNSLTEKARNFVQAIAV